MGKFAALDYLIEISDGAATPTTYDLSDHISSVELPLEVEALDSTAFGGNGWRARTTGLKDASIKLSFHQDFDAGSVDDVLWGLFGSVVSVSVRPRSTAIGPTNPEYVVDALVASLTPVKGDVGALASMDVTWPAAGPVERFTS